MKFLQTFAQCFILRFCHEWGPYKRWGAARHVKRSGILIRALLFEVESGNRFSDMWAFHVFVIVLFEQMFCPKSVPEVSGGPLGPSPTNSGPFWTNSDQKSPNETKLYIYIYIKKTLKNPL